MAIFPLEISWVAMKYQGQAKSLRIMVMEKKALDIKIETI